MKKSRFQIGDRWVGEEYPPLVIAEIGINHGGSLELAVEMADAAIRSGAEVIKHQTHIIEDEMSDEAKLVIPGNADISIYEIMQTCALSEVEEYQLMNYVVQKGQIFISTPFSRAAVDRLIKFDIPAFKIGSGECNNYPLIRYIAKFGKPVIVSTGMNSIETVSPTVEILRQHNISYALMHCTNLYPTPPEFVRLGAIQQIKDAFPDAVLGLSDHTTSNYACFGAVALGASILERHFTDSMHRDGPDVVCSMDPKSLSELIKGSKEIFACLGGVKEAHPSEDKTIAFAFASVVAIRDISPGEALSYENIWVKRPGGGDFRPQDFDRLIGMAAKRSIHSGKQIKKEDIISGN